MTLRKEELERLTLIKQEIAEGLFNEDLSQEGPAFITRVTCEAVCTELNVHYDPTTRSIMQKIKGDLGGNLYDSGITMAQEYFQYFKEGTDPQVHGILQQIYNWLDKYSGEKNSPKVQAAFLKNVASVGITIVTNAFHRQVGPEFLDRLKAADPGKLLKAFTDFKGDFPNDLTIIERVRSSKLIPRSQVFLNSLVTQLSQEFPFHPVLEDGAATMYNVINELWPSLKPPPTTLGK